MLTILVIYIAGMLSCWVSFYLHCRVLGWFTNGQALLALIFSLWPFGNLLGFAWLLGIFAYLVSNTDFWNKEHNVKPFN